MPPALSRAYAIEALCKRYPGYTPETAANAPVWVLGHVALIGEASGGE